jgi:hypothetical protein
MVTVSADVGSVAADLQRLDRCLKLRYSESGDCWIVYRIHRNGEPCREDDPERTEELVLTAQECDQRIIKRLEFIDPQGRGGYKYADALEQASRDAKGQQRATYREKVENTAELVAHEIRRAEGARYKGDTTTVVPAVRCDGCGRVIPLNAFTGEGKKLCSS